MPLKDTYEDITPAMAEKYLNMNTNNRALRSGWSETMAADMSNGDWGECVAPIVFYEDGSLADGQHRLFAIVLSGVTIRFLVRRGLKREDGLNIDTGRPRNVVDASHIAGLDNGLLTHAIVSTARCVEEGERSRGSSSHPHKLELVEKHREAVEWAVKHGPTGRNLRNAVILGAIARAWYVEADKDRLHQFCKVFSSGLAEGPKDYAAVALRNYYLAANTRAKLTSAEEFRASFLKSQMAICNFMRGKSIKVIRVVSEEVYPLLRGTRGRTTNAPVRASRKRVDPHRGRPRKVGNEASAGR